MKLTEFQLIERIKQNVPRDGPLVICGIGDDCAVLKKKKGLYELITTDCLVEDIHFKLKYFTPFELGKKAFAVSASDIAAMGGRPLTSVITLGIPSSFSENWIESFYDGFRHDAEEYNVSVVGGDITRSPKFFWVNVCQMGEVRESRCKFRKGAFDGDKIFVSGPLGSSAMGYHLLQHKKVGESPFVRAHKTPHPKIQAGEFLAKQAGVTSMIDISDGLIADLSHILELSRVGAEVFFEKIPCEETLADTAHRFGVSLQEVILGGGEDYELLFTVNPQDAKNFVRRSKKAGFNFYPVGVIVSQEKGMKVIDKKGDALKEIPKGYDHFG